MHVLSSLQHFLELDVTPDGGGELSTRRSNRRRLKVFMTIFLVILLPGLTWNFLRPAEYRATARVQITPGSTAPRMSPPTGGPAEQPPPRSASDLLTQVQVLTSRPLLAKVADSLARAGHPLPGGDDPEAQLQEMIRVLPVGGTEVVELQATGVQPELLARALNFLVDRYHDQMKSSHGATSNEATAQAAEEAALLEKEVRERRERLDAFRSKHGVWSTEPEGNEAVERMRGLTNALNTAVENATLAESRLRTLEETIAGGGKSGSRAKDDPTLASMEQRASASREELQEMERAYTPAFMDLDPRARAMRARLSELERQIEVQRSSGQQTRLAAAQEDLARARATVQRLQAQINEQRKGMQTFSERFTQARSLADDLAQIEKAHREALERVARLEASERSRFPVLDLIEAASVPQTSFRPQYLRDSLIVLGTAFALGLLAMWFVELFNRQPPAKTPVSTTVIVPQPWGVPGAGVVQQLPASHTELLPMSHRHALGVLAPQAPAPRELTQEEAGALLAASAGEARFIVAALLMGLTADETVNLRQGDFDPVANTLRVRGNAPRVLVSPPWLAGCRPAASGDPEAPLLADANGAPFTAAEIESVLACAAFDAGLAEAAAVTAEALRHTCIACLVRQGVRFADLASLVGRPSAEALAFYADLAPAGARLATTEIQVLMPALLAFRA